MIPTRGHSEWALGTSINNDSPRVRRAHSSSAIEQTEFDDDLFTTNFRRSITEAIPTKREQSAHQPIKAFSEKLTRSSRSGRWGSMKLHRAWRLKNDKEFGRDRLPSDAQFFSAKDLDSDMYRLVYINDDAERDLGYPRNEVCTSKYTWWSFVPVFLYLTFKKIANIYFLLVGVMQMIPSISPTKGVPLQFVPLFIVVVIDAIFAAYEDYKRHIADDEANSTPILKFNREMRQFETRKWSDLQVGDIVKIFNRQVIPADILIIAVRNQQGNPDTGTCYVETKSLDGETNLKLREAPAVTNNEFDSDEDVGDAIHGVLQCEIPNSDINSFSGTLYLEGMDSQAGVPIDMKNMLLRGCRLRNTFSLYGLVVNTGVDTKIMMSSGDEFPVKRSTIDILTNRQVAIVVLLLVLVCFAGAIGNDAYQRSVDMFYVTNNYVFAQTYFTILTTLATMVPITLYVSITIVKAFQVYFMQQDLGMYHEDTDSPMQARNMQLNEQLGQISHIFSDKTGTLTCNKMEFRKCSINGVSYGSGTTAIGEAANLRYGITAPSDESKAEPIPVPADPFEVEAQESVQSFSKASPTKSKSAGSSGSTKKKISNVNFDDPKMEAHMNGANGEEQKQRIEQFFLHLAVCHSVLIEEKDENDKTQGDSEIRYSASSPDEQALVCGAKYFGYQFVDRVPGKVTVKMPSGELVIYSILQVFEFNSTRKRMSIIARRSDGLIELLCKGADNVIFERLDDNPNVGYLKASTLVHLEKFARDGLRTLVIASKVIPESTWEAFSHEYAEAVGNLKEVELKKFGKDNLIDRMQNEMEMNLTLLGATGIEDRLQDGVPDTMANLARAGMNIWVLTGDMEETAINIGFASRLLTNEIDLYIVNLGRYPDQAAVVRYLDDQYQRRTQAVAAKEESNQIALVIDGASLSLILDNDFKLVLLRFALLCKVVIACRVSPQQKAQLVSLVKKNCPHVRTLAIGDGANDVPMIQSAHVGVGIIGEEGMQAVNNSDFALGQFRFLQRLLLVHGRWNYYRIAHLIVYTFYKNVVYCIGMFWYIFSISAYSGTMIYSAFIQQGYNLFFTAIPIVVYAVTDQDIADETALKYPQVYHTGPNDSIFNYRVFWKWIILAMIDSLGVLWVPLYFMGWDYNSEGRRGQEYELLGTIGWTALCSVVNARFCLMVNNWTSLEVGGLVISLVLIYGLQYFVDLIPWPYAQESFPFLWGQLSFWLVQLITIFIVLTKDYCWAAYKRLFRPEFLDLVREVEKYHLHDNLSSWTVPPSNYGVIEVPTEKIPQRSKRSLSPRNFRKPSAYRGFTFDQPAAIIDWIIAAPQKVVQSNASTENLRELILASDDPVIFENQRYQPFLGYGSTYPGHFLPTDRGKWSDRQGKYHSMVIPTAGLEVNLSVPHCDSEGWVYASDFKRFNSANRDQKHRKRGLVRRREWIEMKR